MRNLQNAVLSQAREQNRKYVFFMAHDMYIIQNQPYFYTGSQISRLLSDESLSKDTIVLPHVINVNTETYSNKEEKNEESIGLVQVDLADISLAKKFEKYDNVYVAREGKCGL